MSSMFNIFAISGSALTAQSVRLNTTASNMANADSVIDSTGEPYRAKEVVFQATPVLGGGKDTKGVIVSQIVDSAAPLRLEYNPNSPAADENGYVAMPNVDVVEEMVNMISASRSYQNNTEVMNTAKQLLQQTLSIGGQ